MRPMRCRHRTACLLDYQIRRCFTPNRIFLHLDQSMPNGCASTSSPQLLKQTKHSSQQRKKFTVAFGSVALLNFQVFARMRIELLIARYVTQRWLGKSGQQAGASPAVGEQTAIAGEGLRVPKPAKQADGIEMGYRCPFLHHAVNSTITGIQLLMICSAFPGQPFCHEICLENHDTPFTRWA